MNALLTPFRIIVLMLAITVWVYAVNLATEDFKVESLSRAEKAFAHAAPLMDADAEYKKQYKIDPTTDAASGIQMQKLYGDEAKKLKKVAGSTLFDKKVDTDTFVLMLKYFKAKESHYRSLQIDDSKGMAELVKLGTPATNRQGILNIVGQSSFKEEAVGIDTREFAISVAENSTAGLGDF